MPHTDLVFLISQPRSGSTLLQRILGTSREVATCSEPWLMLYPASFWRSDIETPFSLPLAQAGVRSFLHSIGGKELRDKAIASAYGQLYEKATQSQHAAVFLDKTPRYYFVIDELLTMFPHARFIFLLRNPLAVLNSMMEKHEGRIWENRRDLLEAPRCLVNGVAAAGSRSLTVRYEDLVVDPDTTVRRACDFLGIAFDPGMLRYDTTQSWVMGDRKAVLSHTETVSSFKDKWKRNLQKPQHWRVAKDYLGFLGPRLTASMGYDHAALSRSIDEHKPALPRRMFTVPLSVRLRPKAYPVKVMKTQWRSLRLRDGRVGDPKRAANPHREGASA